MQNRLSPSGPHVPVAGGFWGVSIASLLTSISVNQYDIGSLIFPGPSPTNQYTLINDGKDWGLVDKTQSTDWTISKVAASEKGETWQLTLSALSISPGGVRGAIKFQSTPNQFQTWGVNSFYEFFNMGAQTAISGDGDPLEVSCYLVEPPKGLIIRPVYAKIENVVTSATVGLNFPTLTAVRIA